MRCWWGVYGLTDTIYRTLSVGYICDMKSKPCQGGHWDCVANSCNGALSETICCSKKTGVLVSTWCVDPMRTPCSHCCLVFFCLTFIHLNSLLHIETAEDKGKPIIKSNFWDYFWQLPSHQDLIIQIAFGFLPWRLKLMLTRQKKCIHQVKNPDLFHIVPFWRQPSSFRLVLDFSLMSSECLWWDWEFGLLWKSQGIITSQDGIFCSNNQPQNPKHLLD